MRNSDVVEAVKKLDTKCKELERLSGEMLDKLKQGEGASPGMDQVKEWDAQRDHILGKSDPKTEVQV
jgi:hypothetical protein